MRNSLENFAFIFFLRLLASNIEGDEEPELLAEYEALVKRQQQKNFNAGPRPPMNNVSPNKRRQVMIRKGTFRKGVIFY